MRNVARWQHADNALNPNHRQLCDLNECDHWFDEIGDFSTLFERTYEIIKVHNHMNS
jgi:hypothetical protein